jgi:WD40 repeat protein
VQRLFCLRLIFFLLTAALLLSACAGFQLPPTPSSTPVLTQTSPALPDLVAVSASVEQKSSAECVNTPANLVVSLQVKNQGNLAAGPFEVEINGARHFVKNGLTPGEQVTLQQPGFQVRTTILVDTSGQIQESDETNNRLSARLAIPTLPVSCLATATPALTIQEPLFTMQGHSAAVTSVAFSPNGGLLASGSVDNTLRLWRSKEGLLLRTMRGHPFPVLAVDFSPNGTTLATGSTDGLVRTWELSSGLLQDSLSGHGGWVPALDYSPDGRELASGGDDFTVRFWRLADSQLIYTIDEAMSDITDLSYSPDGELVAWTELDGSLRIWHIQSRAWMYTLRTGVSAATSLAFSPDSAWIVSGYADGSMRVWSVQDGSLHLTMPAHAGAVSDLVISTQGDLLVSASADHNLKLWQVLRAEESTATPSPHITIRPIRLYIGHTAAVNSVAISPQGDVIASGSDDATVRIWPVSTE